MMLPHVYTCISHTIDGQELSLYKLHYILITRRIQCIIGASVSEIVNLKL